MPVLKYLDTLTGTYKPIYLPSIAAGAGLSGDGSSDTPLKAETPLAWGGGPAGGIYGQSPDLRLWGSDSLMGNPVYVDSAGDLRSMPEVIPDAVAKKMSDLPGTYPQGMSITTLYTANAGAGGWPYGVSATVLTFRRHGDSDTQAVCQQWWYRTAATAAEVLYRTASGNPSAWGNWRATLFAFEEIPNGADLNTYQRPGQYVQSQNNDAAGGTNYPAPYAGLLEVGSNENFSMMWQRYTTYSEAGSSRAGNATWTRAYYVSGAGWSDWVQIGGDTGWIDIPIQSGFTAQGTEKPQVRMFNGVCYSRGGWSSTGLTVNTTIDPVGTMPVGYRPTQNVIWRAGTQSGPTIAEIFIAATGNVSIRMGPTATYVMLGVSWLTS